MRQLLLKYVNCIRRRPGWIYTTLSSCLISFPFSRFAVNIGVNLIFFVIFSLMLYVFQGFNRGANHRVQKAFALGGRPPCWSVHLGLIRGRISQISAWTEGFLLRVYFYFSSLCVWRYYVWRVVYRYWILSLHEACRPDH